MFTNYMTVALRRMMRYKGYTGINVAGLALGLTCCLFIFLYVRDELSYDRFYAHASRTFRIVPNLDTGGQEHRFATTPAPWGPALRDEYPAVEAYTRFATFATPNLVTYGERGFYEDRFFWADSSVFQIFDLAFLRGHPPTALTAPNTLVLTEETARRYFGDEDPLGKILRVDEKRDYRVTGVLEQPPSTTHFPFDMLASFTTFEDMYVDQPGRFGWGYHFYFTYLLLNDPAAAPRIAEDIPNFVARHRGARFADVYTSAELEPLPAIYLQSDRENDRGPRSDPMYVRIFSAIALFVLLLACINFMNLTTAQAAGRAKEVGVRKALGAGRSKLVGQFLGEALLLALVSAGLAAVLVVALLPLFNLLAGTDWESSKLADGELALSLAGAALVAGLMGGMYPALYLSRPQPAQVLKTGVYTPRGGVFFRKGLVVFQFAVSVFLMAGTAVVYGQLRYVQHTRLGFDQERAVIVPMLDVTLRERYPAIKNAFRQVPNVRNVAASSTVPGALMEQYAYRPEGLPDEETMTLPMVAADYDFIETMGLTIVEGRAFSEAFPSDAETAFLVNEALVRKLGWNEAVGKSLIWVRSSQDRVEGQVVGVVEDFHTASLREAIEPVVLQIHPARFNFFTVRLGPGDVSATLAGLGRAWSEIQPGWPFHYSFLDDDFAALYASEQQLGRLATTFAGLAVLIACLGLFGLAAFQIKRRTKEIGIRKAMGATVPGIVRLLSKDFLLLVLIAVLVAIAPAYLVMQHWLDDFAYRIAFPWLVFLIAGLATLAIAFLTICYRTVKAARTAPAHVLRYE